MPQERRGLRQVAAFAREAGVSVLTLHLYDRMGLLRPAALTGAGYRLYGAAELERLEQILALRFISLPLEQIKELLADAMPLGKALALQREAIVRQRKRLDTALAAIERAQARLESGSDDDRWGIVRNVIAFTGGNAAVHDGVSSLWSDQTQWPEGFTRPWSDGAQAFISRAMNAG